MYRHRFLTLQSICGVSFYIIIPLARISASIQALLRQGFGIPSGNVRVLSTDAEDEGRKFSQNVRGSKVIRLLGNKANPHNRLKKYRLCGFVI